MGKAQVVLIEPDGQLAQDVLSTLESAGHRVFLQGEGTDVLDDLGRECPDLVVVDLDTPELDGLKLTWEIRRRWRVGIIVVTSRRESWACVQGLEMGADDYMRKPFSARELAARVAAVLRRLDE